MREVEELVRLTARENGYVYEGLRGKRRLLKASNASSSGTTWMACQSRTNSREWVQKCLVHHRTLVVIATCGLQRKHNSQCWLVRAAVCEIVVGGFSSSQFVRLGTATNSFGALQQRPAGPALSLLGV